MQFLFRAELSKQEGIWKSLNSSMLTLTLTAVDAAFYDYF